MNSNQRDVLAEIVEYKRQVVDARKAAAPLIPLKTLSSHRLAA